MKVTELEAQRTFEKQKEDPTATTVTIRRSQPTRNGNWYRTVDVSVLSPIVNRDGTLKQYKVGRKVVLYTDKPEENKAKMNDMYAIYILSLPAKQRKRAMYQENVRSVLGGWFIGINFTSWTKENIDQLKSFVNTRLDRAQADNSNLVRTVQVHESNFSTLVNQDRKSVV